jgi:arylsulfatase A-like enzyme
MNTIFIIIDTLRRDHLGCDGNDWIQTPNLDALARKSTVFENAYLGSYPCMPARRDMWTGRFEFPWRGWGPLETTDPDIAKIVTQNGHTSMVISDHYHMWERGSGNYFFNFSGAEFIRGQENDLWITDANIPVQSPGDPERMARHALRPGSFSRYSRTTAHFHVEEDYFAPQVFRKASEWVERNRTQKDFFLMLEVFDPHEPFDPPFPYDEMYNPEYKGQRFIWPTYGKSDLYSEEELKEIRALYAGEVTMVDRWLGHLLDTVEHLGLMDDTMIIVVTDHGHLFGEHGMIGKPWSDLGDSNMYQELAHIPLLIYHPNGQKGKRVSHLAQPVDLFATILDGFNIPLPAETHGQSLLPYILHTDEGAPIRETAVFGRYGEAMNITDGEWTLYLWPPGEKNEPLYWYSHLPPQFGDVHVDDDFDGVRYSAHVTRGPMSSALYNIKDDPQQEHNLYDQHPEVVDRLKAQMRDFLLSIDAPSEQLNRIGLK